MALFSFFKRKPQIAAQPDGFQAAALPPVPPPKAPKGQQTFLGYRTNITPSTSATLRKDRNLATTDRLLSARDAGTTPKVMRSLVKSSPDLSSAVSFMLRTGIPERYTLVGRDMDGNINPEATALAHELLRRMTYLGNVDGSFAPLQGLQSLSEQLALELILDGAACLEVALDKARVPASLSPVSVTTLEIYDEDKSFSLKQKIGGTVIDLDLPTIIFTTVDQLQTEAYPSSYLESAIQPIMTDIDFNNDMRRALKRAVLPRLVATLDSDKVKKMTPPDILADAEQFALYKNTIIAEVESKLNSLNPEDALVSYDALAYDFIDGGHDPSGIIEKIQKLMNRKLVAGAKTLPLVLGDGATSSSSSTEALLYLKQCNMIRVKLNEMYSRAMTLAVRLLGQDCYVEFSYAPLDLRPEAELEAYRSMEQSRVLDLLSLGLLTDEEASLRLTGNLPPKGYTPKSGTMFRGGGSTPTTSDQPGTAASGTSNLKSGKPTTPTQPKTSK